MKKNDHYRIPMQFGIRRKWLLVMKFFLILFLAFNLSLSASVLSQTRIALNLKNASFKEMIQEIESKTELGFIYNQDDIKDLSVINLDVDNVTIEEVLDAALKDSGLEYEIDRNIIIIKPMKLVPAQKQQQERKEIKGKVVGEDGEPVPGVHVIVGSPVVATTTNSNGEYILTFTATAGEKIVIKYSFIGMKPQTVVAGDRTVIDIIMKSQASDLKEVVVTGLFDRKKETYTGNVTTVSGEELLRLGTTNIIESISQIDPSFRIIENNEFGSDPNKLPELRFRGTSNFSNQLTSNSELNLMKTDPNLPLFILDGYQVSLQDIIDMDMVRIESVTILKDAVSAAIYGSNAANGVFVIKTKTPKVGKVSVSFNSSYTISVPDFSSFDLLSGRELLDLQHRLGIYGDEKLSDPDSYNLIKKWLHEGVDSDWKYYPVRNAVTHKQSLSVSGGDPKIRYGMNINYADTKGVMKGSDRGNMGINFNLTYKVNDRIDVSNRVGINRNKVNNSNYGSFKNYSALPPYFAIYDDEGNYQRKFGPSGVFGQSVIDNPLIESEVGNYSGSTYTSISNNFSANMQLTDKFRLTSRISYSSTFSKNEDFNSPLSTHWDHVGMLDDVDFGIYKTTSSEASAVSGNLLMNYHHGFNGHMISASCGFTFSSNTTKAYGYSAQGFSNEKYFPSFAKGYEIGTRPKGQESKNRTAGLLLSANYSYNNIFLCDVSYKLDGSSSFGNESKYAPFFAIGAGLNLTRAKFIENSSWIQRLRITGSYGEVGSVAFESYQAKNMFTYDLNSRYNGIAGTYLKGLGNENLKWQTTISKELSLDMGLFSGAIGVRASVYDRKTVDMIVPVTLPASAGFKSLTANLGAQRNRGIEVSLRSVLFKTSNSNLILSIAGGHNENKILDLGGGLQGYNEQVMSASYNRNDPEQALNYTVQFQEGKSQTGIYAVRSLGIDPQTGKELFLDRNGKTTWDYNPQDQVLIGDESAIVDGNISLSYAYKQFTIGVTGMYRFGGEALNRTLLLSVENADKYMNVDRRAAEDTWKQPGDIVSLLAIGPLDRKTQVSSRFLQDNDFFKVSGMNLGYAFSRNICEKMNVNSLRLSLNLNDLYYRSTIKRERGTSYPFAHKIGLSLNANF